MRFKADEIVSVLTRKSASTATRSSRAKSAGSWKSATASPASTACPASWPARWSSSPAPRCAAWPSTSKKTRSASSSSATTWKSPRATRSAPPASSCSVPVGDALIGRVVDPLGNPLDGKGPSSPTATRPVESIAPGVAGRQPVNQPLQTGIKAIDAMTPIGRGQRELIIGDRKTGKTAIAVDTIINQKRRKRHLRLRRHRPEGIDRRRRRREPCEPTARWITPSSSSPRPPTRPRLQYIAPYAGCAMAEYYMYEQGRDTLCVYDDLTKQAAAYRQLSLLMRRPPGREAYPGDIFYCPLAPARTLRQAGRALGHRPQRRRRRPRSTDDWGVNNEQGEQRQPGEKGKVYVGPLDKEHAEKHDLPKFPGHKLAKVANTGGSLTALPIIETLEGEVSAYIPTNVISITDGQIYLQPDLFFAGVRPAIDVGISVSRVGGKAQIPAMKQIAGSLRLDLAAFRELEAFAQLGTELDKATQSQLDRGYRMVEILKQPQFKPMNVIDQVMIIYAGTKGFLDKVPIKQVAAWEEQFLRFMHEQRPAGAQRSVKENEADARRSSKQLNEAIEAFQPQFKARVVQPLSSRRSGERRRSSSLDAASVDASRAEIDETTWPTPEHSSNAARRSATSARSRGRWS